RPPPPPAPPPPAARPPPLARGPHAAGPPAGAPRAPRAGARPPHGFGPLVIRRARLAAGGAEDRDAHDRRERFEALDELPHDAEDPRGVLDREVQHRVPAGRLQGALPQRVSTGHVRSRLPGRQTL